MIDYQELIKLHAALDFAGLDALEEFRVKTLLHHIIYIDEVGGIEAAENEVLKFVVRGMQTKKYMKWAKNNEHK